MELTSQLASLEDDIKLLKGEIKSILKEIRAAVLSSDNPFTNPAAVHAVTAAASLASAPPAPAPEPTPFSSQAEELPRLVDVTAARASSPFDAPVPLRPEPAQEDRPEGQRTGLLTIAALLTWSEDAIAALGARRFRFMLELALFADLLSPEIRDVLRDSSSVWAKESDSDQPVSANECLLQLRQLEAIVSGDRVDRIPRRRAKRRGA